MEALINQEAVPVVMLTVPEANTEHFIIERSDWDAQYGLAGACLGESGHEGWIEGTLHAFCLDQNLDRGDITHVDFDQTRTREELDNLPDFQY